MSHYKYFLASLNIDRGCNGPERIVAGIGDLVSRRADHKGPVSREAQRRFEKTCQSRINAGEHDEAVPLGELQRRSCEKAPVCLLDFFEQSHFRPILRSPCLPG